MSNSSATSILALVGFVFVPLAAAATGAVVRAARPDPERTQGTALQIVVTTVLVVAGQLFVAVAGFALVHVLLLIPPLVGALMARSRGWRQAVRGAMFGSFVATIGLLVVFVLAMISFMQAFGG
jgi:hypothetical protein